MRAREKHVLINNSSIYVIQNVRISENRKYLSLLLGRERKYANLQKK